MSNANQVKQITFSKMFFKNHQLPAISVKTVLKNKESQRYIMEQTEKQLAKWGIDDEYIIEKCYEQSKKTWRFFSGVC